MGKQTFEERVEQLTNEYKWAVAFFKEMSKEFGKEKAIEIASRALTGIQQETARRRAEQYGATFEGFRRFMHETASVNIVDEGSDFIRTSSPRCAAWAALSNYGLPQLCRVYCDTDPAYAKAFSPKLTVEAESRLSDGGCSCDYVWQWKE